MRLGVIFTCPPSFPKCLNFLDSVILLKLRKSNKAIPSKPSPKTHHVKNLLLAQRKIKKDAYLCLYSEHSSQWFSELVKEQALKLFKNIDAWSPSSQKFWKWGLGMCILSKLFQQYWSVGGQKLQIYVSFSKGAPQREKTDQCWVKCLKTGDCKASRQVCLGTETEGCRGAELQFREATRREEAISR